MKITPLEIRQKSFERVFRGYEKEDVDAYLLSLSQEWERLLDKNKDLHLRLEAANREVAKLREVESSLYKTLKTAEDTGQSIMEQAQQKAELKLKEVEMDSDKRLSEAKTEAIQMIEEAEIRADEIVQKAESEAGEAAENMMELIKELEHHYRAVEDARDHILSGMIHLSDEIKDRIERATTAKEEKKGLIDGIVGKARVTQRKFRENLTQTTQGTGASVPDPVTDFNDTEFVTTKPDEPEAPAVSDDMPSFQEEPAKPAVEPPATPQTPPAQSFPEPSEEIRRENAPKQDGSGGDRSFFDDLG
ncbi:hypothetical protein FUAX_26890 [Fulvitalea axinellae]|uniref:DivIVA domain-containing protein n=1 Tax=Fulvitalea axinellae TaxID=1182444 RepID=A0AAU9CQL5_9BACT|nr:hypothetical protein FUAX_26890 [Fulvitalea axinellae]